MANIIETRTKTYSLNEQNEYIIFDKKIPSEDGSTKAVAYNITWEQNTLFSEYAVLYLTAFGSDEEKPFYNIAGIYNFPQDIYYSKIRIEIINRSAIEDLSNGEIGGIIDFYGQITFQTISEEFVKPIEDEKWKYFLENTKLALFTVPAGQQLFDIIEKDKIYEYVELFYTLEGSIPLPMTQVIAAEEDLKNKLYINDNVYEAKENWSAAIPGKAIPYAAQITKEDNVRLDVYLRYWVGEKGEHL